ncbi:hypothetical protein BGW39_008386 [Mortierella sp. 14UC]|nr:hypothetical protein BGW39_008386 [Mortierella sp. 14UC]
MSVEDAELEDRSQVGVLKLKALVVDVEDQTGLTALGLGVDESYRLLIAYEEDPDSDFELDPQVCKQIAKESFGPGFKGTLKAKTIYGALHGLETFAQLVTKNNNPHDGTTTREIAQTPLLIHARPLFPHRGVLLDTSRNFLSMVSLYRTIDAMAMNKFNVFHWHIVDSPSFPIALDDQVGGGEDEDKFVHGGADEVNFNCWNATKSVVDMIKSKDIPRSKEGVDRVLDGFTGRQHEMLRNAGKRPIVWEEPLLAHDLTTIKENKDTVVQVWTSENIKKTVRQGYDVITGSADYWHMDCGFGDWLGNWTMGKSWCAYSDWQKAYSFNPLQGLNSKESKKVLGGEALLWGEQVDNTNLDTKLWPRASAVAEVLWSGNAEDSISKLWDGRRQTKNTLRHIKALDRINEHRFRMEAEKILAEPFQPLWCVKNPGHCN